ncbi:MAG: hypothetical protein D6812_04465 [Deltaproteobacteria bacterium]|nr:MAG: hypothetical protein D6812_04465 [Deltaproteobacteria bacterium]
MESALQTTDLLSMLLLRVKEVAQAFLEPVDLLLGSNVRTKEQSHFALVHQAFQVLPGDHAVTPSG